MKKQVLVIGLGQFGAALVGSLSRKGVEVIAIDKDKDKVRAIADVAASASSLDATDEEALAAVAPGRRDVCICAIGDEAREASILCTALLRQLGATRVLARATDELHGRILSLIGAHDVINPESIVGERVATRVAYEGFLEEFPLGEDVVVTEVVAPSALVGRRLVELELPAKLAVTVVAIRRADEVFLPRADSEIRTDDVLVLISRPGAVEAMLEKLG